MQASGLLDTSLVSATVWTPSAYTLCSHALCSLSLLLLGPSVLQGELQTYREAVDVADKKKYFSVVKAAFGQRRKTLLNALANSGVAGTKEEVSDLLQSVGIEPNRRGETLSLEEFALIVNAC